MSILLEQGYVGFANVPLLKSSDKFFERTTRCGLNLKATGLRLGLPGFESPERNVVVTGGVEDKNVYPSSMLKSLVYGAKRGFSYAFYGGFGKWLLSGNGGFEVGLCKDGGLFSPRDVIVAKALVGPDCTNQQVYVVKDKILKSPKSLNEKKPQIFTPAAKEQVVGWPPIRSFRKNSMATQPQKNDDDDAEVKSGCLYVKVNMDGAPYLRKVDLKNFSTYRDLSSALEKMFSCFTINEKMGGEAPIFSTRKDV